MTGDATASEQTPPTGPVAVVVQGDASPEELAALVAVLSAVSGGETTASEQPASTWAAHAAVMRHPVNHGPGAWRTSLRP